MRGAVVLVAALAVTCVEASFETKLRTLYEKYNPSKVDGIPAMLKKHKGKEKKLVKLIREKYGVEPSNDEISYAVIQSCSGCKLNRLPEVSTFVKDVSQFRGYQNCYVEFIDHHNPDLVLFDEDEVELKRIDLSLFSLDSLHRVVQKFGFQKELAWETQRYNML